MSRPALLLHRSGEEIFPYSRPHAELYNGVADGKNLHAPMPGPRRGYSYRHGFRLGRCLAEFRELPWSSAEELRRAGEFAMKQDETNGF